MRIEERFDNCEDGGLQRILRITAPGNVAEIAVCRKYLGLYIKQCKYLGRTRKLNISATKHTETGLYTECLYKKTEEEQ